MGRLRATFITLILLAVAVFVTYRIADDADASVHAAFKDADRRVHHHFSDGNGPARLDFVAPGGTKSMKVGLCFDLAGDAEFSVRKDGAAWIRETMTGSTRYCQEDWQSARYPGETTWSFAARGELEGDLTVGVYFR